MTSPPGDGASLLRLTDRRGRLTLLTTVLGSGMSFLDGTIVNVALPTIGRELRADLAGLQWVVNGYALTLAALILLGGSLGDRFGRRRTYSVGTAAFGAASTLCAISPGIATLTAARAVQGVAAALLVPGSLAILQASFVPEDRMKAIGAWTGLTGVATASGPLVGGWLVGFSWRYAFWLNVPVAVAVVLLSRVMPESRNPHASHRLDVPGVGFAVLGLAGTTYALTAYPSRGADAVTAAAAVVGVGAMAAFVVAERRSNHPMMPPSLFTSRAFSVVNVVTLVVYAALSGALLFLIFQLQVVAGWSPLQAGAATVPISLTMLLLAGRFGALATRLGPRPLMVCGTLVAALGFSWLAFLPRHPAYLQDVLPGVGLLGLGLSMLVAPLTGTVLAAAPDDLAGTASGVNNAVSRAAGLFAVAGLPVAVGLSGTDYADPSLLAPACRAALLSCAGLLVAGAVLTRLGLPAAVGRARSRPGPAR